MTFDTPLGKYRWVENWVNAPGGSQEQMSGRTHGVAVLRNGEIVLFRQGEPAVLFYSPEGELCRSWGNFPGAHGLTVVEENGEEFLWLVDEASTEVVKTSLDGQVVQSLPKPPHALYESGRYVPTWVAVAEERFGGNGDIWLTDGYGSSLVHRFDKAGNWLATLDGTEGAGRFSCPHGLALDTRRAEPEFYIADRKNRRFQVYGMDGGYRRTFGADFLNSPDVGIPMGSHLLVPELVAGLTILDGEDRPAAAIGFNSEVGTKEGWPNERRWVEEGKFNSPHSAAADANGNIYVVEWITGGRVTKLERL